jgi:hypothetical protein
MPAGIRGERLAHLLREPVDAEGFDEQRHAGIEVDL